MMRIPMFALMGKNMEKIGFFSIKLSLMIKKDIGMKPLVYSVKVHNMDTDQLVFGDREKMNLTTSDYFMLHSLMGENESDKSFTILCQNWKGGYFDGNSFKIISVNPDENLFKEIIV